MNRIRQRRRRTGRQWLGLCLVLLLAVAPALNLAGVDLALQAWAEPGAHQAHPQHSDSHSGHHNSGERPSKLAHHTSSSACLQCLALGGMSLAGAAAQREPAPALHAIGAAWALASLIWDSRDAKLIVCRGPPALA